MEEGRCVVDGGRHREHRVVIDVLLSKLANEHLVKCLFVLLEKGAGWRIVIGHLLLAQTTCQSLRVGVA